MAWHGQEPVNDGNNVEQEVPVEPQDDRQGRWLGWIVSYRGKSFSHEKGIPSGNLT